jgi:hypothetical protein
MGPKKEGKRSDKMKGGKKRGSGTRFVTTAQLQVHTHPAPGLATPPASVGAVATGTGAASQPPLRSTAAGPSREKSPERDASGVSRESLTRTDESVVEPGALGESRSRTSRSKQRGMQWV